MVEQLIEDSRRGLSLLQSAALRDAALTPAQVEQGVEHVLRHPDESAYHVLFALRRGYPDAFARVPPDVRARVMCAALAHVGSLNDWGYLEPTQSHDGEAAAALLETGRTALECLRPLLDDTREAPLFGSEAATLSAIHQYRRADFAYRYASLILGLRPAFRPDPPARDEDIRQLKARL
jgi:hypothetical protein